jgi:hypothetical protein
MLHKLEVVLSDMQRDQAAAMLTFEQRHWAALLANERRIMEKIEEGNVQVVAALALKLDTLQVRRGSCAQCFQRAARRFLRTATFHTSMTCLCPKHRSASASVSGDRRYPLPRPVMCQLSS